MTFADFDAACDCHFHILSEDFPTIPNPSVRNFTASVEEYRRFASEIGITRGVVVQPSLYGTNNRCTLDAVAELGPGYRAVLVVHDTVERESLRHWHDLGARGARFNQVQLGATTMGMLPKVAHRIAEFGWHIQLHMLAADLLQHAELLTRLPAPVVLDHAARLRPNDREELACVLRLLESGKVWVKLSGPYFVAGPEDPDYANAVSLARILAAANPERAVWGSDWPHVTEAERPTASALRDFALGSLPDKDTLRRVLVDNPAKLYGL